jgi:2-polyprenyl-3-methyl-5-hydroxy-6-metoxy-1,4-benzoquinol methylase
VNLEDINERENWHVTDDFSERRYSQLAKSHKGFCQRVLDVGVGSGIGGIVLKEIYPNASIFGIDIVENRTVNVPKAYAQVRYESGAITSFDDGFFNLIVAGEVLEHVPVNAIDDFIHEMFRILAHGGTFALTTPNPDDVKMKIRRGTNLGGSHVSQHFIHETCSRLRMSGFRIRSVHGTGKTSSVIGKRFPKLFYGSYLIAAVKI